ncbi:sulfotransferase family protein [Mycolicibacterium celeriflavum]|uniref:Putative sulfotransferase n=1 Tax=Mycolicibacterium celeriflavum TaxID=1249101 RepID=A0A1X0C131_MYCCF|nr:sulfotransferase [Mycolicibacterium celeriflavum]MCV7238334.1 sulfotransferase [Mycolicibacterium celeriflavum]ORA50987.1 sulfotransferase family protein [Mycolicibacterium celeriflavum]BBY44859.1 putative sulfotransferase [Mycolicibacterium celeriflavum]
MIDGVTRPASIRLTDLADPVYPPEAQPMREALAAYGATLELTPQVLLATATERTGLDDWGDPGFRERLDVLCGALVEEAGLSDTGTAIVFEQLVGNLVNRLRLAALITEHPEIEEIGIERPIIICGLPRTGTTHLHNLIAADPAIRYLPYWESLEPFPAPDEHGPQPRRERCAAGLELVNTSMPEFKRMHDMTVDHAHEEIQLLANDVSGMLFETTYHVPSFAAHYKANDQAPSYAYLKRSLQALQWLRGGSRWVLKSPQYLEQFPALVSTFPDAVFVVTHRDPVEVTQSMATMVSYAARMSCARPDPRIISRYWLERAEDLLNGCVRDRDALPAEQSVDVRFEDFMADEEGTIAAIYELADQPLDADSRAAMAQFRTDHPRGRYGGVLYQPADLGLDIDDVNTRLRAYRDRFVSN